MQDETLSFPALDARMGHILVNFFYTERYETLEKYCTSSLSTSSKLRQALLIYITASKHGIGNLKQLAYGQVESLSSNMLFTDLLSAVNDNFAMLGPDDRIHGYLRARAEKALQDDPEVFIKKSFGASMHDADLLRFAMSHALSLSFATKAERPQEQSLEAYSGIKETELKFAAPRIDNPDEPGYDTSEAYDVRPTSPDEFSTISCPLSSCSEGDSEVPVDDVVDAKPEDSLVKDEIWDHDNHDVVDICADRMEHILQGDLWKDCTLCRNTVEQLAAQTR